MDTIDLKRIFHRGKECVGLYFDNKPGWYNELKVLTKGKVILTGSGLEDDKESASISNIVVSRSIKKSISKVSTPLVEQPTAV